MGNLPSGTVTFLLTDIEGSTKLAQEHPDEMPVLLTRHNEILNQAIEAHNGYLFRTAGDAYCVAFHNPRDALDAALDAQRLLNHESWSPAPIKVRMGIHTGAAQPEGEANYSGYTTLALVQRVMSAGHGGQILISQTVRDLLASNLPDDVNLIDMGEHHLKDVLQQQHLYQLQTSDLPSEFPPLKTQKTVNHNLPVKLTSFIGRARELSEAKTRLADSRLLTLIGPGGTGKTRLSIQLGGELLTQFPDGVWMTELAPVSDAVLIPQTIASVFGLREDPGRPLVELVTDYLRAKTALVILDNCEHLIEACARLAESLIQACANLKILASSREALGIAGETTYRVPSLYLPDQTQVTGEAILEYESVQLFVDRASAANPKFQLTDKNAASVAQVCRRLDGIPLALELAAARVRVLSVVQIAERLDDRFRLLTGGSRTALPRQQTLRALIDWSYDLLTESEKALFRRLAVFVGGWTLEAAEAVCAGDGVEPYEILDLLTQLVDKSLVIPEERDGEVRYHRLETIRQYAREKLLETNEAMSVRDRHLDYFIELSNWVGENMQGLVQEEIVGKLALDGDNIRSALSWAVENQPVKAMELFSWEVVFGLWVMRGYGVEARDWCQTILSRVETLPPGDGESARKQTSLVAQVWNRLSQALMNLGDHQGSREAAEKSLELARMADDQKTYAEGLASLGIGALYSGDPEYALEVAEESIEISKRMKYQRELAWGINTMIHIYNFLGDDEQKRKYQTEYKTFLKNAGVRADPVETEMELAVRTMQRGDLSRSLQHVDTVISILTERGDKYRLMGFQTDFAHSLREQGKFSEALSFYRRTILLWQDFGHRAAVAHQLECFALIAIAQSQPVRAVELFGAADVLREVSNSVRTPAEQKEFEEAKTQLQVGMEESEFAGVWKAGQAMSLEEAVGFALEENK